MPLKLAGFWEAIPGWYEGAAERVLARRRRSQNINPPMSANPTTTATTSPAIAPTFVFPELVLAPGVAVVSDEEPVGEGSLVDSGPPVP